MLETYLLSMLEQIIADKFRSKSTVAMPRDNRISDTAIRQELNRVLASPIFSQSDRLARFLRYTVEHAISGKNDGLKEYVIGTEVYDRKPPYHPSQDSIVRTEARRLRAKLKEYYESEGREDPVFIYFRPGSYIPVFRMKDSEGTYHVVPAEMTKRLFIEGAGVPIAVVPFLDVSGQPLSGKYARGVTDELVHELMHSEGCRVVAASSIAHLGPEASDVPSLARRLGVQVIFEGTVREEGSRLRVTARIVNADGFQLWSQRFDADGNSSSFFAVQEQFASALVSRVRPRQSVIRSGKAAAGPVIFTLYPAILKGEALIEEGTSSDVQAALSKFRDVIQAAPEYARPFCGVAQCYCWLATHGAPDSSTLVARAREAAERALELDPQMSEAFAAMGGAQMLEWSWEQSESSFKKAVEPGSYAISDRQYAALLTILGRFDEAWLYLESAQQIDPFSYLQKAACAQFFYLSRRYEDGLAHFTELLRYGPLPSEAYLYLALIHLELGHPEEARKLAQHVQRRAGAQAALRSWIAEILAYCQETSAANSVAEQFGLYADTVPLSKYRQALLAVALNDTERALSLLASSLKDRDAELPCLSIDPRFDSLRNRPEFVSIVRTVQTGKTV